MQSGTTGINTVRIYNPVKQGHDQDPDGDFVRRWVPELRDVPDAFIHEPWQWEQAGSVLDRAIRPRLWIISPPPRPPGSRSGRCGDRPVSVAKHRPFRTAMAAANPASPDHGDAPGKPTPSHPLSSTCH